MRLSKIPFKTIFNVALCSYSKQAIKMTNEFPKTLKEFGYGFNAEGRLRKLNPTTGLPGDEPFEFNISSDSAKNQRHYEALGETITEHVYKLLEENGMHKIYMPEGIPKEEATFIFCNKPILENPKKLMVLIHGSGVVRAGQWARSLIINQSLDHGTQLPYVKTALERGYDIIILNTNDNYRTIDGKEKAIFGHSSPITHASSVWEKFIIGSDPECVGIVAHSYGGVVTMDLARKFPELFKNKVFAIGFTDSVHSFSRIDANVGKHLRNIGRNWVTSAQPLDEEVSRRDDDIPRYSAGHVKHEWTSYSCMSALFDFFDRKYEEFTDKKRAKKQKAEL